MIRLITLLIFLIVQNLIAQDFQGVVTYKTNRKLAIKLDSTQLNSELQKQIHDMMKKQFQKEYTLRFDKQKSVYKIEESLGAPQPTSGVVVNVVVQGSGAEDVLYKDIQQKKYVAQRDMFGKTFLVKDSLQEYQWNLVNETKKIGDYTCYKAIFKRNMVTKMNVSIADNDKEKEEDTKETKTETEVTAWYTPEIPISNGPGDYWGLPGLILEMNDGVLNVLCSKIVINPNKKVQITAPTKGKEVSGKKYKQIMDKKMKEMEARQSNRSSKGEMKIEIRS